MPTQAQRIEKGPEAGAWTAHQKLITLLAALAIIWDGFDIQVLGFAIPSIMKEWHVARSSFAPIAALGLAGMAFGSPMIGYCGDRFGRRATLISCVSLFGLATVATAFCTTLTEIGSLRFLTGMAMGGALPNANALVAEFAPLRRRALAVTLTTICIPLGGMLAGLVAARVLPALGWHALYMIGGAAPLVYAMVLLAVLPESPQYLARRAGKIETTERAGDFRALLAPALRRDTLALWLAFFLNLNAVYLVFGWLPSMLASKGLGPAAASSGLAAYNFGGVLGVLLIAVVATVWGSRVPLLWAAMAGCLSALALLFVPITPGGSHTLLVGGLGLHGLFVNAVQTTMFALAAHMYPTRVRATGIACASAVGRVGGIVGSLAGSAVIQWGSGPFLVWMAIGMGGAFVGLALVRNHFPGTAATGTAATTAAD